MKIKIAITILSLLFIYFGVDFIYDQNKMITHVNRLTPLELPENSRLEKKWELENGEVALQFQLDPLKRQKYWEKYTAHPLTYMDEDFVVTDAIYGYMDNVDLDTELSYYVQFHCQQGTIYMSSMNGESSVISIWMLVPDFATNPDCEGFGI